MLRRRSFAGSGFALFVLIGSLLYVVSAMTLGPPIVASKLSPSFFPIVLGSLSSLLSLVLVMRTVREKRTDEPTSPGSESGSRDDRRRALSAIGATAVFVVLFQTLGFFASTIPYVLAIIVIFSDREKLLSKSIFALVIALAGYVLFTIIFNVRLPAMWS